MSSVLWGAVNIRCPSCQVS
ncbi:hypothetical protein F3J43_01915 [Pantoea sp. Cy-639]|nr:hypothetical protein [Pantoea sp. Cy-639]